MMESTMGTMEERVDRGVALLDEKFPSWKRVVSAEVLDMSQPDLCIMGQLFGGYGIGLDNIGIDNYEAEQYGFDVTLNSNGVESYRDLNHEWLLRLAS